MRWLIIFNNYNNLKIPGNADPSIVDIRQFLPEIYYGSVIVIIRLSKVNIGYCIKISKLENIRDGL
jgi:hypothetical protein